ncbi:MAG: FAD-dependent oxidoreductase [Polyangiaceae bacterium]|nr:FAD-dependent oxidoreductase [Polyangiaceae bacterium]
MAKKKVLILGGGLSALSAGVHLLQEGGKDKFEVTLLCMEDRLGGKAASWRFPDGRFMEIGFHAVFGYYRALQTLVGRGGHAIDNPVYFTPNEGEHLMYEASARAVNRLDIPQGPLDVAALFNSGFVGYQGMSFTEKLAAARWMATTGARLLLSTVESDIDEHAFTAYCVSTGLDIGLTRKSWFRYVLDLAFNYPNEGSAYVGMYGFQRLMGPENSTVYYLNGPLSEIIVRPVADLFVSLGGSIEFCTKVTRIELDPTTKKVTQLGTRKMADVTPVAGISDYVTPTPIGGSYSLEENPYPVGDPAPATGVAEVVRTLGADFDEVVCTLPVDSARTLLSTTPDFERAVLDVPELRRMWGLRSVASLSMRMWLPEKVMPSSYSTVVMGTPQPGATIIDYTNRVTELAQSSWGSVIEFEGQEGRHAGLTDMEIARDLLESFDDLPFVDSTKLHIDKILNQTDNHHFVFRRNTAHHLRYLLMEPGHWKYRVVQEARPYENLTFAGDWMVGSQPTASMEAAVRTGRVAANLLRAANGLPDAVE